MTWQGHPRTSTAAWKKLRRFILERDRHRCQLRYDCCIGHATDCDHITAGGPDDPTNLQAACVPCHRRKSAAEGVAARRALAVKAKRPNEPHPGLTGGG